MKFIGFIPLLLLFLLPAHAQDFLISEETTLRNDESFEIIGQIEDQTFLFITRPYSKELISYNRDLKIKEQTTLSDENNALYYTPIIRNEHIYIFFSTRKNGDNDLSLLKLDDQLNQVDSTVVKSFGKRTFSPKILMRPSQNKKFMAAYTLEKRSSIEVAMIDLDSLKTIWEQEFAPAEFNSNDHFIDLITDNSGNAHFALEHNNTRASMEENKFEFFSFYFKNKSLKTHTSPFHNHSWTEVLFEFDNQLNRIIIAGLYKEKKSINPLGIFQLSIYPEPSRVDSAIFHPFGKEFIAKLTGKEKRKKIEIEDLTLREMVLRSDGGILVISELERVVTRRSSSGGGYYSNRTVETAQIDYFLDEIILFNINPEGNIQWKGILRKKQSSQDDNAIASSFFMARTARNLKFIFNDNVRADNNLSVYNLNGKGQTERISLMNPRKYKLYLRPRLSKQISASQILIPSVRKRELKLIRLDL